MIYNVFIYIYLSTIHNLKCKNKKLHLYRGVGLFSWPRVITLGTLVETNKRLADTDTRKGNSQHAKLFL